MREFLAILVLLFFSYNASCQKIQANCFIRLANLVNFDLTDSKGYYTPALATGFGLSHGSKFIEVAGFVDRDAKMGLFTFFGSTMHTRPVGNKWKLHTNWFGELTFIPGSENTGSVWITSAGLCFVLNRTYTWGSIGIPLCLGGAYSERTFSLNARAIFNVSLDLRK